MNKKSFTETQGKKPFNWYEELSVNCNKMTVRRAGYLSKLSSEWVTCATGNQCYLIPRNKDDACAPVDSELKRLGLEFYNQGVYKMYKSLKHKDSKEANLYRKIAIDTLDEIEKRSSKIISDLIKQSKYIVKELGYEIKKAK